MTKHTQILTPFLLLSCLILFITCQKEEFNSFVTDDQGNANITTRSFQPKDFFHRESIDEDLETIINCLESQNEITEFVSSFIEHYGYPLWDHAKVIPNEENLAYIVPMMKEKVETIWFFEITPELTRYYVLPRPTEDDPLFTLDWMFDYFNIELSCYTPENENEIIQFIPLQTRGLIVIGTEYCNHIYTGYIDSNGVEHLEYSYTHCWMEYQYAYLPDPGSGGGLIGGGGGGGGGGGTLPILPKKLTDLFKSTSLSPDDQKQLEAAIDDLLDDCYAEAIYNYLVGKGARFSDVVIDPNLPHPTAFDLGSNLLSFQSSDGIGSGSLYHEMFHLFQKSQGSYTGKDVIGLMEYERTLFEDIAFTIKHTTQGGEIPPSIYLLRKSPWVYTDKKANDEKDYKNWLQEITKNGKEYPSSIPIEDFKRWAIYFGQGNRRYGQYNYSLGYNPIALHTAINLAITNCKK